MDPTNPYVPPSGSQPPPSPPPAAAGSSLDFGRALGFFFQDPNWVSKMLMGTLFSLLSVFVVGSIFIAGYAVRLVRRTAQGEPYPLPEWDDLGGMFTDGLSALGAYLAHLIPVFALIFVAFVPLAVFGGRHEEPSPALLFLVIPLGFLGFVAVFALLLYFPAAFTRLAVEGRFGAAFELDANWAFLKRNVSNYFLAIAAFILANFLSQFGILLFCIGILPATFWSQCVGAYALGEVALKDPGRPGASHAPPVPRPSV